MLLSGLMAHCPLMMRLQAEPRGSSGPLDAVTKDEQIGPHQFCFDVQVLNVPSAHTPQAGRLVPFPYCTDTPTNHPHICENDVKHTSVFELRGDRNEKEVGVKVRQFRLGARGEKQSFGSKMTNKRNMWLIFWV